MNPLLIIFASARILAFMVGCFIIVCSLPLAFGVGSVPSDTIPDVSPLLVVPAAACLLASGFLLFGIFGGATTCSTRQRIGTAVLLMLPLALGASMVFSRAHPEWSTIGLFFFVPASIALVCVVWPERWQAASEIADSN